MTLKSQINVTTQKSKTIILTTNFWQQNNKLSSFTLFFESDYTGSQNKKKS